MKRAAKRVGVEVAGWTLLVVGIAAIPLPGPGWLMVFAAMLVLAQEYEWARRSIDPVRYRALKGAADSVQTHVRVAVTASFIVVLAACGVLWIASPAQPGWWPLADWLWLPGGLATGITQIASAVLASGLLVWSYRKFHGHPEALAALDRRTERADRAAGPTTEDERAA